MSVVPADTDGPIPSSHTPALIHPPSPSSTKSRQARLDSAGNDDEDDDEESVGSSSALPDEATFEKQMEGYIESLDKKKRPKALITQALYSLALSIAKDPENTRNGTAQDRFWVKKTFELRSNRFDLSEDGTYLILKRTNEPVAVKSEIYRIISTIHLRVGHGGRDKTHNAVKAEWSKVPKELSDRFVKSCPTCQNRPNSAQINQPPSNIVRTDGKAVQPIGVRDISTTPLLESMLSPHLEEENDEPASTSPIAAAHPSPSRFFRASSPCTSKLVHPRHPRLPPLFPVEHPDSHLRTASGLPSHNVPFAPPHPSPSIHRWQSPDDPISPDSCASYLDAGPLPAALSHSSEGSTSASSYESGLERRCTFDEDGVEGSQKDAEVRQARLWAIMDEASASATATATAQAGFVHTLARPDAYDTVPPSSTSMSEGTLEARQAASTLASFVRSKPSLPPPPASPLAASFLLSPLSKVVDLAPLWVNNKSPRVRTVSEREEVYGGGEEKDAEARRKRSRTPF